MKTNISLILVLVTISGTPAFAGGKPHSSGNAFKSSVVTAIQNAANGSRNKCPKPDHERVESQPITSQNLISNSGTKLPPGGIRGDGRVPVVLANSPPPKPGFVWAGDHWERAKASGGSAVSNHVPGSAVVNTTQLTSGEGFLDLANSPPPVVLNPNVSQPNTGLHGSGGRPHLASRNPGGITVSVVPGSQRPNDVTGEGGSVIDDAINAIVGTTEFHPGKLPPPQGVRDHRTAP